MLKTKMTKDVGIKIGDECIKVGENILHDLVNLNESFYFSSLARFQTYPMNVIRRRVLFIVHRAAIMSPITIGSVLFTG